MTSGISLSDWSWRPETWGKGLTDQMIHRLFFFKRVCIIVKIQAHKNIWAILVVINNYAAPVKLIGKSRVLLLRHAIKIDQIQWDNKSSFFIFMIETIKAHAIWRCTAYSIIIASITYNHATVAAICPPTLHTSFTMIIRVVNSKSY